METRRKNLVLMLCVPSAPCTGGAVLFSTEQVECRSAVGLHILKIASMHILMHTPYRLRQTCNDLRRLQPSLTPSIIENRRLRSGLADHVRPPRPAMLGG